MWTSLQVGVALEIIHQELNLNVLQHVGEFEEPLPSICRDPQAHGFLPACSEGHVAQNIERLRVESTSRTNRLRLLEECVVARIVAHIDIERTGQLDEVVEQLASPLGREWERSVSARMYLPQVREQAVQGIPGNYFQDLVDLRRDGIGRGARVTLRGLS